MINKGSKETALTKVLPKELVTTDDSGRSLVIFPVSGALEGLDNLPDSDRFIVPKVKLLQSLSDEVQERLDRDLEPGVFIHSVTKDIIKQPMELVLLYPVVERYFHTPNNPRELRCLSQDGKGLYGTPVINQDPYPIDLATVDIQSDQGDLLKGVPVGICKKCPYKAWQSDGRTRMAPMCTEVKTFFSILKSGFDNIDVKEISEGNSEALATVLQNLVALSCYRTSAPIANQIVQATSFDKGILFARTFFFKSQQTEGPKGPYFKLTSAPGSRLSEDEIIIARGLHHMLKKTRPVAVRDDDLNSGTERPHADVSDADASGTTPDFSTS